MNDLGLDSLDQVEVIMAMEDEFGEYLLKSCEQLVEKDFTWCISMSDQIQS